MATRNNQTMEFICNCLVFNDDYIDKLPAAFVGSPFIFYGFQRFIRKGKGTEKGGDGVEREIQVRH